MKPFLFIVLVLILCTGCSFGKLSKTHGSASLSLPFDFGYKSKEETEENKAIDEMIKLEAEMISDKRLESVKESE